LRSEGWYVVRIIQASVAGIPDLLAIRGAETKFVEVKAKGGKVSKIQQYRHDEMRAHGIVVEVVSKVMPIKETEPERYNPK